MAKARTTSKSTAPRNAAGRSSPRAPAKRTAPAKAESASRRIDDKIKSLGDWRGKALADVRRLIHKAVPDIVEEIKWVKPSNPLGVPVWSSNGIICTGEVYNNTVKLTFPKGASLEDPSRLFNAGLAGGTRRAIDIREGDKLDARAFTSLIRSAAAHNRARSPERPSKSPSRARTTGAKAPAPTTRPVRLLSGGNPQIPKGDGDAPVQAFIAAMPGSKRPVGARLDALIERTIPAVRKAVKWNSPFYGVDAPDGKTSWFLSFHVFARYIKVAFFRGSSLRPLPPIASKDPAARYVHLHEGDFDERQLAAWIKQAAAAPGWVM